MSPDINNDYLLTLSFASAWLGYYSPDGTSEPWVWVDNTENNFTAWKENHPIVSGEACASIMNDVLHEWEDTNCSVHKHYVCESMYLLFIFQTF